MQEGQLLMSQAERDRLVALKKAHKKLIAQREAAAEVDLSVRQVQRLLEAWKERGDQALTHGLLGRRSNRKLDESIAREAVKILSAPVYAGFGPTLAAEYLRQKHGIEVSRETVRQWMLQAQLWRGRRAQVKTVHLWRPRRRRFGELVQWDTSEHDWLEGRGETLCLIAMIDDATSQLWARFVRHDSTEENMRMLWEYLEQFGRPLAFYTDKASLFHTTAKRRRDEPGVDKDLQELPPTQLGRALRELGIGWIAAHSPQAKGRVERNFGTAQDRLVKGLRVAGVRTLEAANAYLRRHYPRWWAQEKTVQPDHPDDAHRKLDKGYDLAAILSHVETRQVRPDYTLRCDGKLYQIERQEVTAGLRNAHVRVEWRLDGTLAVRHRERYLAVSECAVADKPAVPLRKPPAAKPRRVPRRGSDWNKSFDLKKGPKLWQLFDDTGGKRAEPL